MYASSPKDLHLPTIPVSYPLLLLEILEERGVTRDAALRDTGIHPPLLSQAEARLTTLEWVRLAANALELSGDEGLGYEYGLRLRPSAHGFLGYAAMTGASMREAVDLGVKYFRARLRQFQLHFVQDDAWGLLELRERERIPVLRNFFIECILIGLSHLHGTLIGETRPDGELWFDWPEPVYYARYRERLPNVRFSQPANLVRFPVTYLERRPLLADEAAHQQALTQVEREFAAVREEEDGDLVARVRAELHLSSGGYQDVRSLCARLGMSPRTLRRKLGAQRTSYQTLLDEARQRDARHLLEASDLDVQTISARVGFDNPANFTRAFKRWTGCTPSGVRHSRVKHQSQ